MKVTLEKGLGAGWVIRATRDVYGGAIITQVESRVREADLLENIRACSEACLSGEPGFQTIEPVSHLATLKE